MYDETSNAAQIILDSVADGVFTVDRDWRVTSFNRAVCAGRAWPASSVFVGSLTRLSRPHGPRRVLGEKVDGNSRNHAQRPRQDADLWGKLAALGTLGGYSCSGRGGSETASRMIILGLDGMDPRITERMMREGKLPNFVRLARAGQFGALGTSTPPQSPVAWANFITGCNPGGHGIFDFIHRNPEDYSPYLSTSRATGSNRTITIGDYEVPLSSGEQLPMESIFWSLRLCAFASLR